MIINIITPFPDMFKVIINESIMLKSHQKGVVKYNVFNLFDFLSDSKDRIDDYPFGGGEGMILKAEPIYNAIKSIENNIIETNTSLANSAIDEIMCWYFIFNALNIISLQ